jgi:hypothetical protein
MLVFAETQTVKSDVVRYKQSLEVKAGWMCDAVCKAAISGLVIRQAEATIADIFSNAN